MYYVVKLFLSKYTIASLTFIVTDNSKQISSTMQMLILLTLLYRKQ